MGSPLSPNPYSISKLNLIFVDKRPVSFSHTTSNPDVLATSRSTRRAKCAAKNPASLMSAQGFGSSKISRPTEASPLRRVLSLMQR
ncbi:hypothetical protein ACKVWC_011492 [Pyricularia oryzae]